MVNDTLGAGTFPEVAFCLSSAMVVTGEEVGIGAAGNSFLVAAAGEEVVGAIDPCTRDVDCTLKVAVSVMDGGVSLTAAVMGDELGVDTVSGVEDVGLMTLAVALEASGGL